jgi:hypothetical protein
VLNADLILLAPIFYASGGVVPIFIERFFINIDQRVKKPCYFNTFREFYSENNNYFQLM